MRLTIILILLTALVSHAQETKTSMGFVLSPNFSSVRYLQDGSFSQSAFDSINARKKGAIGLSGNVFFQYEITEKFLITWGLGIQNYRSKSTVYTQTQIEHPTITRETKYNQSYIQFSVSAKYRIYESFYARAGIGVDLLAQTRAERTESCPGCEYYFKGNDNSTAYNESMIPATFGLGYELKLNERLNLMTELFGTMSLTRAFNRLTFPDDVQQIQGSASRLHMNQKPVQLGFSIGIIRSF